MADEGISEFIEGFNAAGKPLERITQQSQLHELHKQTNSIKTQVETTLAAEMDELQKIQNDLNHVNDQFLSMTNELEGMKRNQQFTLDNARKTTLSEVMHGTLEDYLERRPTNTNDTRSVHVCFLTGEEVGSELHVGREGAGSRDATFIVTLKQEVQSLATQAAKYWGLDPDKVFFLDRDGRIVQGKTILADIILPPLDPELQGDVVSDAIVPAGGGGSASSSLAIPGSGAKKGPAEDQIASYTVKGRDYCLTLVRSKTVLAKEDLSQPKGEKWNDFTFDPKQLNEDLAATRKKRGDPDPQDLKISVDTIPSLYDLIKRGNLRKFQKQADKWCRIIELCFFFIMWVAFTVLLKPDSTWVLSMNMAGQYLERELSQFNLAEQKATGIQNFSQINERKQFQAWVEGPLQRAVLAGGLDSHNAFPVKVQARSYFTPTFEEEFHDIKWCTNSSGDNDDNATSGVNASNDTVSSAGGTPALECYPVWQIGCECYPVTLKQCPSKGVVELMFYAMKRNQRIPPCVHQYEESRFVSAIKAMYSVDAFSFATGDIATYLGGRSYELNLTSQEDWSASLSPVLPAVDVSEEAPAKLINVITFLPAQSGIAISQFLTEFTPSGPLAAHYSAHSVDLRVIEPFDFALYHICIFLGCVCLILELRRITGWPERFFFEARKEACGPCTFVFMLVPILLWIAFSVLLRKEFITIDVMKLKDNSIIEAKEHHLDSILPTFIAKPEPYEWSQSEKVMFDLQMLIWLDWVEMLVNLTNFTLMMLLSFRYFLVYFPEMRYITQMIRRVTIPVMVSFFLIILCFACYCVLFFMTFGDQQYEFRDWQVTTMAVLQFAHGGFTKWEDIYQEYAWTWYILMIGAFVIFTLNLNHILIAVFVSHKKEAELHKHYSSHPFWQLAHRQHMQAGKSGTLNPALAGYDFGNPPYKDGSREVKEQPGWKI